MGACDGSVRGSRRVNEPATGSTQGRSGADITDLFRLVFDHTATFAVVLAADGALLEANRAALAFTGLTRGAVVGRPLWETPWLRPQVRRLVRAGVTRAARGTPLRRTFEVVGADGRVLTLDVSLRLLRAAPEPCAYILVEGRELARERAAAGTLSGSTAPHRALLDALGAGVICTTATGAS